MPPSRKHPRKPIRAPRRFLTERLLNDNWDAIDATLRGKKKAWGIQGWSVQGKAPELRVVVKVPFRRVSPRTAVAAVAIKGTRPFILKVGVEASFCRTTGVTTHGSRTGFVTAQSRPLAPGAPIEVASGGRSRCGVAAILDLDDEPYLLTCGHTFRSSSGKVFVPGGSHPVAELTRNIFDESSPLDAAVCKLTSRGRQLLDASADADTWFNSIHTPEAADNNESAVFWPTSETAPDPIEVNVESFSASFDPLFGSHGPQDDFIQIELPASEGDSGSALVLDDELYGLCSGTAGSVSYFTAISNVVQALRSDFGSIKPWQPT